MNSVPVYLCTVSAPGTTRGRYYEVVETCYQDGWYWLRDDAGEALHFGAATLAARFRRVDYDEIVAAILADEMRDAQAVAISRAFAEMAESGECAMSCNEIADHIGWTRQGVDRIVQKFRRLLRERLAAA